VWRVLPVHTSENSTHCKFVCHTICDATTDQGCITYSQPHPCIVYRESFLNMLPIQVLPNSCQVLPTQAWYFTHTHIKVQYAVCELSFWGSFWHSNNARYFTHRHDVSHTVLLKCIKLCGNHPFRNASDTARMHGTQQRTLPTTTHACHMQQQNCCFVSTKFFMPFINCSVTVYENNCRKKPLRPQMSVLIVYNTE